MDLQLLPALLGGAVLLPLLSFAIIFIVGPRLGGHGKAAGTVATLAIFGSLCLSLLALMTWLSHYPPAASHGEDHDAAEHAFQDGGHDTAKTLLVDSTHGEKALVSMADDAHPATTDDHDDAHAQEKPSLTGVWYTLGQFGSLRLDIGYYIDALTVAMFSMVSLIALCIHVYATAYMHDELHEFEDHEVHTRGGGHFHRPGRFHRFFQALSLFCFSMLGLVVAGSVAMTFVFWELVGICSYFLIGFYVERHSASTAANKAFIVNRVGDFGMIIGLMALWGSLGTLNYGVIEGKPGLFELVRPSANHHAQVVPDGMQKASMAKATQGPAVETAANASPKAPPGYGLLVIAGLGIFCGCVGKSAQFPLHVWLPDAMEGPTPVSALVHSATMVAAGVFLVARFYPVFTPEVLLVIAVIGTITLFLAATIAITANDIKRVLAYSTVSQLGYMMMSLGIGGWLAGVLHLFTHAFFKSLLFLCSGSVIHAVHTNDMQQMGGLRRKMPWTAYTMLVGCLAIAGAGIPFIVGLSGYYSKDAILEQAFLFARTNPGFGNLFFYLAAGGAAMTAFYMFRLWFLTFAGNARDHHRYDHAHESPPTMYIPLVILATLAVVAAWGPKESVIGSIVIFVILTGIQLWRTLTTASGAKPSAAWMFWPGAICLAVFVLGIIWNNLPCRDMTLASILEQARPDGTLAVGAGPWTELIWPNEHDSHAADIKTWATLIAFGTALSGIALAAVVYAWKILDANEIRKQFNPIYQLLINRWWFDEIYDWVFIRPCHLIAQLASGFDRRWIDGFIDGLASFGRGFARIWDRVVDRGIIDESVNTFAAWTYTLGHALRRIQTGRLRQYVMLIVVATIAIFVVVSFFWGSTFAS
jgi:proton-translocating NADH-quinone oxidoreductase chain L